MEFVKLLPKLNIKCPQKINCVSDCSKCGKGRRRRREKNWYEELEEEDADYIGQAPPRSSPQVINYLERLVIGLQDIKKPRRKQNKKG
jgi:hypothetical protein